MPKNNLAYTLRRYLIRPRLMVYFNLGQYGKLLEFCRRLSPFSKRLDGNGFSGFYIENYILEAAKNILSKRSIDFRSWPDRNIKIKPKVALLATTIVDSGGHTECILRFVETFQKECSISLFLNNSYGDSRENAQEKIKQLSKNIDVFSPKFENYEKSIVDLFGAIKDFDPDIIFVYAHVLDSISVAMMGLIKRYGRAKIVFYNHGDHLLALGKCFADLIIECRKVGQYITQRYSGLKNTRIIPFLINESTRGGVLSGSQIVSERIKLNIKPEEIISLSGFSAHKVLCDVDLGYFKLLKRLLHSEHGFRHLLISRFSHSEMERIREFFSECPSLLDRIIFHDYVPDFEKYVQICDFLIDSFPQGSALTHVDVIKHKKPTVIKINTSNQILSFEDYLYEGYELACKDVEEMHEKIIKLIRHPEERIRIGQRVHDFFLTHYDRRRVAQQFRDLIENRDNLFSFYQPLEESKTFNIDKS